MSLPRGLETSAALYPQKLDLARGAALIVRLSEADYRAASFLDDRILARAQEPQWVALSELVEAKIATLPLHFIFHGGHVGSTLLSRLLDEMTGVLPLREPLPLRQLAEGFDFAKDGSALERVLEAMLRLWGRGFADTRHVVLKATSSAARIAPNVLDALPDARAVYLSLAAEPAIATLLAGENASADLNAHGPERLFRLRRILNDPSLAQPASIGELCAMSWLAEKLTEADLVAHFGARVLPLDFDAFLAATQDHLARVLTHFGIDGDAATIAQSPVLARYSKAPEHAYSPQMRRAVLDDVRRRHGDELLRGLAWLERMAKAHEPVRNIFQPSFA